MAKLTIKEVEHVAKLARLDLSPAEKKKFSQQLSDILDYIDQLKKVDTAGVKPTAQVTGLVDVAREDKVEEAAADVKEKIIHNLPEKEKRMIRVKGVFEE